MLPDWYFCSCVKADPDKTAIFLQILGSLADTANNPELASIGLGELQRLDPWMQGYALPAVLRTLGRQGPPPELRPALERYFAELAEMLPERLSEPFGELISSLLLARSPGETLTALRRCHSGLDKSHLGPPSPTAYLDLRDFFPETLILAVLADRLERDRNFSSLLGGADDASDVLELVDLALDLKLGRPRLGRLAFRCALTVARLSSSRYEMRRLEDTIWSSSGNPELEPDLLASWAELIAANLQGDRRAVVDSLIFESITLAHLRHRLANRRDQGGLPNPLLPNPTPEVASPLSIVIWQSFLWALAVRLSPSVAAGHLGFLWRAPAARFEGHIEIKAPLPEETRRQMWNTLTHLVRLREGRPRLLVSPADQFELPDSVWLVFSPWIQLNLNRQVLVKKIKDSPRYPGALQLAPLVRLLASSHLAGQLLLILPPDHPERPRFGALLVHAADVIESLGLPSGVPGQHVVGTHAFLSTPYQGLGIYMRRHVEQLGICVDERVAPRDFLEPAVNPGDENASEKSEPVLYERTILPAVLISWVTTAFLSATRMSPSARWLPWVGELYERQAGKDHQDLYHHKLRAEAMARFLAPDMPRHRGDKLGWKKSLERPGQEIWQRQILVTRPLTWMEWNRSDLDAAPKDESARIAIALERLALLENPGDIPEEIAHRWRRDWANLLSAANDATALDRFVRLRLLEMLDSPVLQPDPAQQPDMFDGRELIALTVLEYGSVFELEHLFERLYPEEESAWNQPVDRSTRDLRLNLIRALDREIGREAEERATRVIAQDVYLGRDTLHRERLCRETLRKIAFFHRPGSMAVHHDRRICGVLAALDNASAAREGGRLRLVEAESVARDRGRLIHFPADAEPIAEWQIRSAAFDPNLAKAKFLVEDLSAAHLYDLFSLPADEVDAFRRRREPAVVLATVMQCEPVAGERSKWATWFHCGLDRYIRVTLPQSFESGELVSLPIVWREEKHEWPNFDLRSDHRVARLHSVLHPGDLRKLRLREHRGPHEMASTLELRDPFTGGRVDLDAWCGNPAWLFRSVGEKRLDIERMVYARLEPGRVWRPRERGLSQLLLSDAAFGFDGVAVLAWLGADEEARVWRLALRPGEIYALGAEDFAPDDAEKLIGEIERHSAPRGLLVAVMAENVDGAIRLCLARRPPQDPQCLAVYPELEVPFDERNIIWGRLIQRADNPVARRFDKRWVVDLEGPPGFPLVAQVLWEGAPPKKEDDEVEIMVLAWAPWRGQITGEVVQTRSLRLGSGETREDFVDWWLALRRGAFLPLKRAMPTDPEKGDVLCRTAHGVMVFVEPESLSMRFLSDEEPIEIDGQRTGEIIDQPWGRPLPLDVDIEQVPREIRDRGGAEGVLVEVPYAASAGSRCEVWWRVGGRVVESGLQIDNLAQHGKNLRIGARIRLEEMSDGWICEAQPLRGKLRALWTLEEWTGSTAELTYLGIVANGARMDPIAELAPGCLVVLPGRMAEQRHLAIGDGRLFHGGLAAEQRARNRNLSAPERDGNRRVTLRFSEGVLCGAARADRATERVLVSQVRYRLEPRRDGYMDVRRWFVLTPDQERRAEAAGATTQWQAELDKYFEAPHDLDGTLDLDRRLVRLYNLRVPGNSQAWVRDVPLADEETPYVASASYPVESVKVRLFKDSERGRILASFRKVPARSIDEFYSDLGMPSFGRLVPLQHRLYYAGPERTGGSLEEVSHRFEWGYGLTLVASESRLRFNSGPFSKARTILFYGDRIIGLTFLPAPKDAGADDADERSEDRFPESQEEPPTLDAILSIDELQLEFSDASALYQQGERYRIVHLLHLQEREGAIVIRSILGMEQRSLDTLERPFRIDRAELDPASEEKLRSRGRRQEPNRQKDEETTDTWVILARLDLDQFRSSFGLEVVFHLVRMSFQEGAETSGEPMQAGELVFVQTRRVVPKRNDMALELRPWDGIDPRDVGPDCSTILLLRRQFSVREDLLPRIYEPDEGRSLEGSAYLVHLTPWQNGATAALLSDSRDQRGGRARPGLEVTARIPSRTEGALRRAVSRGLKLASVVWATDENLQIELKPGVFLTLEAAQIETWPRGLRKGTVVHIELVGGKRFRISRALQGEEWYVPVDGRPAVALPLNPLLDEKSLQRWDPRNPLAWADTERFSIGGLPNILAVPGRYDERRQDWSNPVPWDFITLMRTPHPKIVFVGRDSAGVARLEPASPSVAAGGLGIDPKNLAVHFIAHSEAVQDTQPLRWELLSFADEPVAQLADRAARKIWRYHDSETGVWLETGGVQWEKLLKRPPHSGTRGPLFFEPQGGELCLRYTERNLQYYGFPVRELVRALSHKNSIWLTVAGILSEGGLWIEIAPGRVADLPASIVVLPVEAGEQSLSRFHWTAFAPGDQVALRLYSSDPMTIDRIALEDWRPGPRCALGSRAILPVREWDERHGALRLGSGELQLTLPVLWQGEPPDIVLLTSDNRITAMNNRLPQTGETVLLGLDSDRRPSVLGFPDLRPLPESQRPASWERDPLASDIAALHLHPDLRAEQLARSITAAGDALPVTVELVVARDRVLYFSRRVQRSGSILPPGTISLGRVTGMLRDQETALIRCGSGLLKAPLDRIVSGLPRDLNSLAVQALGQKRTPLWVYGGEDGEPLQGGLGGKLAVEGDEIRIDLIEVLEGPQTSRLGALCRASDTLALFWLPAKEAAWTPLSREELALVAQRNRRYRAHLTRPKSRDVLFVSLTRLPEVRKEFNTLGIGKELAVRILRRRSEEGASSVRYLAETRGSRIALEVESPKGQELEAGQPILVEIVRRETTAGGQSTVLAVPVGERTFTFDLPSWMLHTPPKTLRPEFQRFLQWMTEPAELPPLNTWPPREIPNPDLLQRLCHLWRLPVKGREAFTVLRWQVGLARLWWSRNESQAEMDLPYALMSLLLLDRAVYLGAEKIVTMEQGLSLTQLSKFVEEWREATRKLFHNIVRRALRSLHVEIFWQEWLSPDAALTDVGDLRSRLEQLRLAPALEIESFRAFQHFCRAVEIRQSIPGYQALLPIYDAIRRATGQIELTEALAKRSDILQVLIDLGRALPPTCSGYFPGFLDSQAALLAGTLDRLVSQRIDITLLDPLTGENLKRAEISSRGG